MRAIIHVGTYKTGSSSLQNFCWDNRDTLNEHGALYPETGLRRQPKIGLRHTGLIYRYIREGGSALPILLAEEIARSGCETLILSSEALANPNHLSFLNQFLCGLRDIGFTEILGLIYFRNIAEYQVRLYREFTVNQRNVQTYSNYIHKPAGMFDYLYLLLVLSNLFRNNLVCQNYHQVDDIRRHFLSVTDLPVSEGPLQFAVRANVMRFDAIDVEIFRCLNSIDRKDLHPIVRKALEEQNPAVAATNWTERSEGDISTFPQSYIERFTILSGWTPHLAESLFASESPSGRNVAELSAEVADLAAKCSA